MGEGRRDRSSRRHRVNLGIEKSSSDTEVGRSNAKSRKNRSKKKQEKWPFLEGLTVDELGRYRRRRVENHPKDTLGAYSQSSDIKEALLVSEYRRAFRAISEDSILKALESSAKIIQDSATEVINEPLAATEPQSAAVQISPTADEDSNIMETALERSQDYEGPSNVSAVRPPLIRRGTSLRRDGNEFYGNTEYSCYVPHEGYHRAELARRPTSLKMEGNIKMAGTTSEQCDKFIEWLNVTRPELARIPTNLKLEGDIETTTENQDKYVPFVGARRPELLRQTAHLKLEGESSFLPEYTDVFREHDVREKRMPVFPVSHLKAGGDLYEKTESSKAYGNPMNNESIRERPERKDESTKEEERKKEQDMGMLVSKLEDLKGPLQVPEYRDAYKVFPRERPKLVKPEDEIGRADGSKFHPSPSHPKFQTKIDQDLEYRSQFIDKDRAVYRKPPLSLRRPSVALSSALDGRTSREFRKHGGAEATSEVRSQYVPYGQVPRVETLKMPGNLRLEGNIDLHPEYRDAYCTRREHASTINEPRAHRHRDRSLSASRRRDNNCCWLNNDNGEQFGQINAASEQDAFQLLSTKVHEESFVGKPPPGSRRARHVDVPSPTAVLMRNRSPSSNYRLQVNNVDEGEPRRGFARRPHRSPSFQFGEGMQSPSPPGLADHHRQDTSQRSYSPSFGRSKHRNADEDEHAFVVLDNTTGNHNAPFNPTVIGNNRSRKLIDRNCNSVKSPQPRNRTPTNWMPPWYDNTSTI